MPVSLEDLSADERATFNLGKLVHTMLQDKELASSTKRLLKKKNPALTFPELDTEDAVAAVREETSKQVKDLEDLLKKREAVDALKNEEARITEAGLDPKAVREFMDKKGITDVEVVIELFESRQALAEPTVNGIEPFRYADASPEELKKMWADPVKWREEKSYEVLRELRGRKPIRQAG